MKSLVHLALAALLAGCVALSPEAPRDIQQLRLLGAFAIERQSGVTQHWGGISGMDWDPRTGKIFLLSDDRSQFAPARFYEAELKFVGGLPRALDVQRVVTLLQPDRTQYPASNGEVPDPEALRVDPRDGSIVWSSEGSRQLGLQPFIRCSERDGRHRPCAWTLPANLQVDPGREHGSRENLSLEGLAFTPDAGELWIAMEGPLYQDGPVASAASGAFTRFTRMTRDGLARAQYAYPVEPIAAVATGGRRRSDNGVSEILALAGGRLLVVERSGYEVADSAFKFHIRIFLASTEGATDVLHVPALAAASFKPMGKRLLMDLNASGVDADNIEAASWGPKLPNGNATLLLAADDNFSPHQSSQFLVFEVIETKPAGTP